MENTGGKNTVVSITLPSLAHKILEVDARMMGTTVEDHIRTLTMAQIGSRLSTSNNVIKNITPRKDPMLFVKSNIDALKNDFISKYSTDTTLCIPGNVPLRIYDLAVDTTATGYAAFNAGDVLDPSNWRVTGIVVVHPAGVDKVSTEIWVKPDNAMRVSSADTYMLGVYSQNADKQKVATVYIEPLTGWVRMIPENRLVHGVLMQFHMD